VTQVTAPLPPRTALRRAALAGFGGMIGTAARLGLGMLIPDAAIAVLIANLAGALILGILTARLPASDLRVFLGTGVLGGFTTYSAFAVDAVQLWGASALLSFGYLAGSLIGGLLAAIIGLHLGAALGRAAHARRAS